MENAGCQTLRLLSVMPTSAGEDTEALLRCYCGDGGCRAPPHFVALPFSPWRMSYF